MATRALAPVRPLPLARPTAPAGLLRALLVVLGALAALALGYLATRAAPVFTVTKIEVAGAPPGLARDVRSALRPFLGANLVGLDGADVLARVESLPSVQAASYDRAFPHTLRVAVRPEHSLAVLRSGPRAWLVAESGRVVREVDARSLPSLPRIRLPADVHLQPGGAADARTRPALRALAQIPDGFPEAVVAAGAAEGRAFVRLAGGTELRLGPARRLRLKIAVAAAVLRALSRSERQALAYLDVSVPERPVGADNPQLSS